MFFLSDSFCESLYACENPYFLPFIWAPQEILSLRHFHSNQAASALYTWRKNEYSTSAGYFSGGKPHDGNRYRT
jgi:hypothetical protein